MSLDLVQALLCIVAAAIVILILALIGVTQWP